ncbi:MAG: DUF1559 domain-containing protein, partial [Verrucomicrobiae bacterium]|nr:DUF1559 domain-containing protein [Verrucomicrobiae bacterium]
MAGERAAKAGFGSDFSFSLIEILIVVSIISVLVALLAPALRSVKEKGRRAVCMNNMKQIGEAMHLYAVDNDGCFYTGTNMGGGGMSPGYPNAGPHFFEAFSNYAKTTSIFYCPSAMIKDFSKPGGYSYPNGVVKTWGHLRESDTHYGYFESMQTSASGNHVLLFENPWFPGHNGIALNDSWILPELDMGSGHVYDQFGNMRGINGLYFGCGASDTAHGTNEGSNVCYCDGRV